MGKWTRRAFIATGSLIGGGLALAIGVMTFAPNRLRIGSKGEGGGQHLTTWIRITPDNEVIAMIPHCEMGQGALTGVAMMLAEELDADWARVRIEEAPADDAYANGYLLRGFADEAGLTVPRWLERGVDYSTYKVADIGHMQITGASSSTSATGQFGMRVAGAAARAMLLGSGSTLERPCRRIDDDEFVRSARTFEAYRVVWGARERGGRDHSATAPDS
jgi:isoquinoline 1-oxidoreductase beta subunit